MEIGLKYGCNPHQVPAVLILPDAAPFQVLNGAPSCINILDALGGRWRIESWGETTHLETDALDELKT